MQVQTFDDIGNSFDAWESKADELLYCSEGLQDLANMRASKVYEIMEQLSHIVKVSWVMKMLIGFAIECLIKAVWLKDGNKLCSEGKFIGIEGIKNHKIHEMISKIGLTISQDERTVLKILGAVATSGGRYPVFTKYDSLEKDFGLGNMNFSQEWNSQTLEPAFFTLIKKLKSRLKKWT